MTEQDSCASHPTTGATRSGPIGGYCEMSIPSAMRVTAPGRMMLDVMFRSAVEEVAALMSLGLFVSMIAIWAQVFAML